MRFRGRFSHLCGETGQTQREGQAVIEIIPALLLFVMMVCLVVSVCLYLFMQGSVISAAREGVRVASLSADLGNTNSATVAAGKTAVVQAVQNFMSSTTGQSVSAASINVVPPTGLFGQRSVEVDINYTMLNPIPIAGFLQAFGVSQANTTYISNIPVTAVATMHYEE